MKRFAYALFLLSFVLLGGRVQSSAQGQHTWAWGANWWGQLGNGTYTPSSVPNAVQNLEDAVAVAAGWGHSLAVRSDGTVWAWGVNENGELGDGTYTNRNTPVQVPGLTSMVAVAAGGYHSLALRSDGTVWAWGVNWYGQLGDGTNTSSNTPVQVQNLTNVVAVAAGGYHSLALRSDGTVWAWGTNWWGQLGDGTFTDSNRPVQLGDLTNVTAIAAGFGHSAAVGSDGSVWTWGDNAYGQLGNGTTTNSNRPFRLEGLTGFVGVAAAAYHTVALHSNGTVWSWGVNSSGQLGNGSNVDSFVPVQVHGITDAVAVSAGLVHNLALRSGGTVWGWGRNDEGQLGDGTTISRNTPVQVYDLTGGGAVAAGGYHSVVLSSIPTETSVLDRTGTITEPVTLSAYLRRASDSSPLTGKLLAFAIDGTGVGSATTDSNGRADLDWVITPGPATRTIGVSFAGHAGHAPSNGSATLTAQSWLTKMATFDRTARVGTLTELKCRLLRIDNVPIANKSINFYVDGTFIIATPTDSEGYARHPYVIPDTMAAGVRKIVSEWPGDAGYSAVAGTASLTVLQATAYIWVAPRTVVHGQVARLHALLRRLPDLQPQQGKTVSFSIDGTWIADVVTGGAEPGVARYNFPTAGLPAGTYTIQCDFAGDAWLTSGFGTAPLTVTKATPHIWVLPRTVSQGEVARLYALFRRLPDLAPQEGKPVSFLIDGTWIGSVVTGGAEPGVARYNYPTTGLSAGSYTITCEFPGDAWVHPGFGTAALTIN